MAVSSQWTLYSKINHNILKLSVHQKYFLEKINPRLKAPHSGVQEEYFGVNPDSITVAALEASFWKGKTVFSQKLYLQVATPYKWGSFELELPQIN